MPGLIQPGLVVVARGDAALRRGKQGGATVVIPMFVGYTTPTGKARKRQSQGTAA